jgi:Kef-type K+ transport system membrane component KefB
MLSVAAFAANIAPLTQFFVQLAVTLGLARGLAVILRRVGQPMVIADIAAGILLGPTLLGAVSPAAMSWLFAPSSGVLLHAFAQLGVVLFMFVVGLDSIPAL